MAQRDPQAQTFSPERRRERAARSPYPVTAAEATTHSGSDLWSQPYPPPALKPLKPETPAHVSSNLAGFLSFPFFHYQLENLQFLRRRKKIKFKKKENKTTTKFGTSWDCALEPWVGQGHSGTRRVPSDLGMTVCSSPVILGFSQAGWAGPTSQRLFQAIHCLLGHAGWLQAWWLKTAFHVGGPMSQSCPT